MNWMNKAFDENRMNYYRLSVPAGPISNRLRKLSDLIDWMYESKFDDKAKLYSLGKIDDSEYIIFIQTDQPNIMTAIANTLTVFEYHPTEEDLKNAHCLLG